MHDKTRFNSWLIEFSSNSFWFSCLFFCSLISTLVILVHCEREEMGFIFCFFPISFLIIIWYKYDTKLIIVWGGTAVGKGSKFTTQSLFTCFYGFFSPHSISHQKQTAYGQTVEHKCYSIKLSHAWVIADCF